MPKYEVTVSITSTKTLTVFAPDEDAAGEKAVHIVDAWDGVDDSEVIDVEEVDD
jgi:hypothetical protein